MPKTIAQKTTDSCSLPSSITPSKFAPVNESKWSLAIFVCAAIGCVESIAMPPLTM